MMQRNGSEPEAFAFFASDKTTTIHLDRGQWVRVKNELTFGEQSELDGAALQGFSEQQLRQGANSGGLVFHTDVAKQRQLKLALYIEDWNIFDDEAKTIRWPRQLADRVALIQRMSAKGALYLSNEIDRVLGQQGRTLEAMGYEAAEAAVADAEDSEAETDPTEGPVAPLVLEGRAR